MPRLRLLVVGSLSFVLVFAPMLSLPAVAIERARPLPAVQPIQRNHRPQELLIKFKPNAQKQLRDAVIQAFTKNTRKLKGKSALMKRSTG